MTHFIVFFRSLALILGVEFYGLITTGDINSLIDKTKLVFAVVEGYGIGNAPESQGMLINIPTGLTGSNRINWQLFFAGFQNKLYIRDYWSQWREWQSITFS